MNSVYIHITEITAEYDGHSHRVKIAADADGNGPQPSVGIGNALLTWLPQTALERGWLVILLEISL